MRKRGNCRWLCLCFGLLLRGLPSQAQEAPGPVGMPGLTAEYYRGYFYDTLSFFTTRTPAIRNRTIPQLNFTEAETDNFNVGPVATYYNPGNPDEFSGRFQGRLCVTTAGPYTFYLGSDDAAYLWIDDSPVPVAFNAEDRFSFRETTGTRTLSAGLHTIRVDYGEHGGSQGLVLKYTGPGLLKQLIPNGVLYTHTAAPIRPVLTTFEAVASNQQVQLNWSTSAEENSVAFVVQKSTDGVQFTELLRQPGAGTTTQPHAYQAVDQQPIRGLNYYRLQQLRNDQPPVYSPIKAVDVQPIPFTVSIYPVPNNGSFYLHIQPNVVQTALLELLDMSGRPIYRQQVQLRDGTPQRLHPDVPTGMYILHLTTNSGTLVQKLPLGG